MLRLIVYTVNILTVFTEKWSTLSAPDSYIKPNFIPYNLNFCECKCYLDVFIGSEVLLNLAPSMNRGSIIHSFQIMMMTVVSVRSQLSELYSQNLIKNQQIVPIWDKLNWGLFYSTFFNCCIIGWDRIGLDKLKLFKDEQHTTRYTSGVTGSFNLVAVSEMMLIKKGSAKSASIWRFSVQDPELSPILLIWNPPCYYMPVSYILSCTATYRTNRQNRWNGMQLL